jgi:hypothetical protein
MREAYVHVVCTPHSENRRNRRIFQYSKQNNEWIVSSLVTLSFPPFRVTASGLKAIHVDEIIGTLGVCHGYKYLPSRRRK